MHARWHPELALAGVVEQQPQSAVRKLGRTRLRCGTDAGRRTRRVADTRCLWAVCKMLYVCCKECSGRIVIQVSAIGGRRCFSTSVLPLLQLFVVKSVLRCCEFTSSTTRVAKFVS